MTRFRPGIVAIQAIVVGVLLLVVFVTLLRPEGDLPLFEIDAPGVKEPVADGARSGGERDGSGSGKDSAPTRSGAGNGARGGGAVVSAGGISPVVPLASAAAATTAPPLSRPSGGSDGDGNSPTDDQYADALSRIVGGIRQGS